MRGFTIRRAEREREGGQKYSSERSRWGACGWMSFLVEQNFIAVLRERKVCWVSACEFKVIGSERFFIGM